MKKRSCATISISEFKATCLAVLEKVRRTGEPVVVTRRGRAVAQVIAAPPPAAAEDSFGCMAGKFEIVGDIVGPVSDPDDWEALR